MRTTRTLPRSDGRCMGQPTTSVPLYLPPSMTSSILSVYLAEPIQHTLTTRWGLDLNLNATRHQPLGHWGWPHSYLRAVPPRHRHEIATVRGCSSERGYPVTHCRRSDGILRHYRCAIHGTARVGDPVGTLRKSSGHDTRRWYW